MLVVRALDVRHGLCIHLAGPQSSMVFDCGTHRAAGVANLPWRALSEISSTAPIVTTLTISHLHSDHYSGFLNRVPNVAADVAIRLPRLPEIEGAPGLNVVFLARLLALDPSFGPLDIDLVRRVRQYAPGARPIPHSAGETFDAAEHVWDVLWPPRRIRFDERGTTAVRKAVEAYDRAAEDRPWLKRRLIEVRESDTYRELVEDLERNADWESAADRRDPDVSDWASLVGDDEPTPDAPVVEAGRLLRQAANHLSLIVIQGDSVLLTGDATKTATNRALADGTPDRIEWMQTPHHGGRDYRSSRIANLGSTIRVSSSGPPLGHMVSDDYDHEPGLHYRSEQHGAVTTVLHRGRVLGVHSERTS